MKYNSHCHTLVLLIVCVYFISVLEDWLISLWFKRMSKNVCCMTPEVTTFAASSPCTNYKKKHEEKIYIFAYIIISVWFRTLVIWNNYQTWNTRMCFLWRHSLHWLLTWFKSKTIGLNTLQYLCQPIMCSLTWKMRQGVTDSLLKKALSPGCTDFCRYHSFCFCITNRCFQQRCRLKINSLWNCIKWYSLKDT